MKKLFVGAFLFGACILTSAQTTITAYGQAKVTIEGDKTTIECDRFYTTECFKLTTPSTVIVKNTATLTANRGSGQPYSKTGIVESYFTQERQKGTYIEVTFRRE